MAGTATGTPDSPQSPENSKATPTLTRILNSLWHVQSWPHQHGVPCRCRGARRRRSRCGHGSGPLPPGGLADDTAVLPPTVDTEYGSALALPVSPAGGAQLTPRTGPLHAMLHCGKELHTNPLPVPCSPDATPHNFLSTFMQLQHS